MIINLLIFVGLPAAILLGMVLLVMLADVAR